MTTLHRLQVARQNAIARLRKDSGLDYDVIDNLLTYANCLCKEGDFIDLVTLEFEVADTFKITKPCLLRAVLQAFYKDVFKDKGMLAEQFVRGLSVFLSNDLEKRIDMAFRVFDKKNLGELTRYTVSKILEKSVFFANQENPEEEYTECWKELTDLAFSLCNCANKNSISKKAFRDAVHADCVILELLGSFFPSQKLLDSFMGSIDPKKYTSQDVHEKFKYRRLSLMGVTNNLPLDNLSVPPKLSTLFC